ncbi:enolase C-terminal domain-like protein [Chelatococcus reniformis]|uniref:Mandelate racemase n=1 Tax=Chelatococcus reniformis TaxID=1494448 RepID=A0A916U9B7_9HYPH|nr:enolase C-terminal domain-like protein [Chelatococcus reniformis]GGC65333.1 mandelate racemase [Chelatococcus reniformis]
MKITDVKLVPFRRPLGGKAADVMIKGQSLLPHITEFVAIRIETDEGITGESLSLGGGLGMAHYLANSIKPLLIGRDPAQREAIWQDMWELNRLWFTPLFAIGIMDVAIWDLYGKSVGRPVHEILGTYQTKLPTYASSMTKPRVEDFVEEALRYKERGYHGYKLHVVGRPNEDIKACQAVRKAVGDDWALMIDVVSAYNQTDALRVGRALEELGFVWYEEPLRDYDIHGYKMLAQALDIPILAVEVNEGSIFTMPEYITDRAIDILRADVAFKGGIGAVKKAAGLAEAFGMNLEVHNNANPVLEAANLAVACSIKNTTYYEQLVPEPLFQFGVEELIRVDGEGFAHVPQGPGLGMKIDWDFVDKHKLGEL